MNDEQFTPQERALIERLQKAPRRRLSPARVDAIQAKILAAIDTPVPVSHRPFVRIPVLAAVAVAAMILGILLVNNVRSRLPQTATAQALAQHETAGITNTAIGQSRTTAVIETTSAPQNVTASHPRPTQNTVPASAATTTPGPGQTGIVVLHPTAIFMLATGTVKTPSQPVPTSNATGSGPTPQSSTIDASATPTPGVIVVVEGPVRAIHANNVTVYDFTIQLQPDDPMLTVLNVGDMARVTGNLDTRGVLMAVNVSNTVGTGTGAGSALVNGRVQAINDYVLTVNGINAQLSPNDPRLKTIQVGSFVSINGNFARQGSTAILVVVNIVIVKDTDVQTYLDCLKHKAMGMGDDAMGMAAPPAMGMGDDAMGMGEPPPAMGSPGCG